jgi:hypothetical protein
VLLALAVGAAARSGETAGASPSGQDRLVVFEMFGRET